MKKNSLISICLIFIGIITGVSIPYEIGFFIAFVILSFFIFFLEYVFFLKYRPFPIGKDLAGPDSKGMNKYFNKMFNHPIGKYVLFIAIFWLGVILGFILKLYLLSYSLW
jgi:hypothetical protein